MTQKASRHADNERCFIGHSGVRLRSGCTFYINIGQKFNDDLITKVFNESMAITMALLQQQIKEIRTQVGTIEDDFSRVKGYMHRHIEHIYETLDEIQATMATRADIQELRTELRAEFKADLAEVWTEITSLRTDVNEMRRDIDDMRQDINEMRRDIDEMRGDIKELAGLLRKSLGSVH